MKNIFIILFMFNFLYSQVIDKSTNLMWEDTKNVLENKKDWLNAKLYCKNLKLDGYENWYLPSVRELLSIRDKKRYVPALKEDFKNIYYFGKYWSSTTAGRDSKEAYSVHYFNGRTIILKKRNKHYVRCCRKVLKSDFNND